MSELKNGSGNLKDMVKEFERQLIAAALSAAGGNQRRAAASLGLLPTTLHEKMKRLGLLRRPVALVMNEEEDREPVASAMRF